MQTWFGYLAEQVEKSFQEMVILAPIRNPSFYLQEENCKDNIYKIDKNSFQLLYGSGKSITEEERYEIQNLPHTDNPGTTDASKNLKQIAGLFPPGSLIKLADAS